MNTYLLLRGRHSMKPIKAKARTRYDPGDMVELTTKQAAHMKDILGPRVERVDGNGGAPSLGDMPWSAAAKLIREMEDLAAVEAAHQAELDGKNRKGVLEAAVARHEELTGEDTE